MQGGIVTPERDLGNAEQREKELQDGHQRIKPLEEEVDGFHKVHQGFNHTPFRLTICTACQRTQCCNESPAKRA